MKDEILPLFRDVLLVCEEMNLLGGTFFALDGSKLPSNASKEWSGTISDLSSKKAKIERKVGELLEQQLEADQRDDGEDSETPLDRSDRRRQIERLRKKAGRIERFLKENGPRIGRKGTEITSNITDNESATMMTSRGTIQGYNGQALVDAKTQVIVHGEAFGEGQGHSHVPPMLDGAKEALHAVGHRNECLKGKILVADSNYHSPTNLNKCEDEHLDAYTPDKNFRTRDPRFSTQQRWRPHRGKRFTGEDFHRDESTDGYLYPQGKMLTRQVRRFITDGIVYRRYVADEQDCKGCQLRGKCLRGKNARRRYLSVPIGHVSGNLTKEMAEKIDTEEGRKIYHQRLAIAEPVFANIRYIKRLDRFTLRSKVKVNIQWLLYCMVHNIGKILNYGCTNYGFT